MGTHTHTPFWKMGEGMLKDPLAVVHFSLESLAFLSGFGGLEVDYLTLYLLFCDHLLPTTAQFNRFPSNFSPLFIFQELGQFWVWCLYHYLVLPVTIGIVATVDEGLSSGCSV